jgi:YgiT-type zinc finger domain-containing protein
MNERKCGVCGGKMEAGETTFDFRIGDSIVAVFEGVPALVCSRCGEKYFTFDVGKKMESLALKREKLKEARFVPVIKYA